HRLVVISHGSRGSDLGHHDLAEYLARNGIVVAAPRHLGDSSDQPRSSGGQQFVTRPWQIVATLDAVLSDPRLRDIIDAGRVGIAGFSAGGYTALVIAGAKPRFELWLAHCADHPDDRELCEGMPPPGVPVPLPTGKLPEETRIRAAVAMAPLGVVFDAPGLATIGIPLRVYAAAHDQVLVNAWNAEHVSGCCHGRRRTRQCPAVTMFSWRPARRLRRRPRHSCASTHRASIAPPFTRRSTQRSWISSIALLALDDPGQKADSV
ncbi:MAG TPA: hypothetical protein VKU84_04375, partial [Stellaceae bacterium]|nr:hypothetical protein [Stellaceae bacterium]